MKNRISSGWAVTLLAGSVGAAPAWSQVVERDTKLTGPKGRTIERSIRTEHGPGFVDRQIEIKRPGGTIVRDTRIQQPGGYGPRPGPPGGPYRPRVIERDVIVERAPLLAPFVAPFLSFSFGSPPPPPPPPPPAVIYVPEPVYFPGSAVIASPPVIVAAPAYAPPPVVQQVPAEPPLPPPVADAIGRLASLHHQSRRDGCLTLGNLGDDRAVTPLMDRLEHDFDREVRVAAAWALGELGDPRAGVVLQRAALYDRRQEVRTAASTAYQRLPKPGQEPLSSPTGSPGVMTTQPLPTIESRPAARPSLGTSLDPGPSSATSSDVPPPYPTPAPTQEAPR